MNYYRWAKREAPGGNRREPPLAKTRAALNAVKVVKDHLLFLWLLTTISTINTIMNCTINTIIRAIIFATISTGALYLTHLTNGWQRKMEAIDGGRQARYTILRAWDVFFLVVPFSV